MPNRSVIILLGGIITAIAAAAVAYIVFSSFQGHWVKIGSSEMAWMKHEYQLSDTQYEQVCELYRNYTPSCAEMCGKVDAANERLRALLGTHASVTPEIEAALAESSKLRLECQKRMLAHFYSVAKVMPEREGDKYLQWVYSQTILPAKMVAAVEPSTGGHHP